MSFVRFVFACLAAALAVMRVSAAEPMRIVSQTVGTDELLLAVAGPEQVAALSHIARDPAFSAVADEARQYPELAHGDVETILKFRPTLVLVADYSRAELVEQIRRAGIAVLSFDRYATLDDAFSNLRLLAKTIGGDAPGRAEKVIEDCRRRTTALRKALAATKPVRVIAPSTYGVIPGTDTTFQDLCEHANAINLAATLGHLKGHAAPPNEQMLTWPIDEVVVSGSSKSEALAALRSLPPYEYIAAVRDGRAALLMPYMLSCVSHRRVDGYERLARELHPEAFR